MPQGDKTIAIFYANKRSLWFMRGSIKLYAGIWEVTVPFDGTSMRLKSLVDWPKETPDHVEVHKIEDRRQDEYLPVDLEQAFSTVMCIRPIVSDPISRISDDPNDPHVGERVVFSFKENEPRENVLILSNPFTLVEGEFSTE